MEDTLDDLALQQLREELLARLWATAHHQPDRRDRPRKAGERGSVSTPSPTAWWRMLCDPTRRPDDELHRSLGGSGAGRCRSASCRGDSAGLVPYASTRARPRLPGSCPLS